MNEKIDEKKAMEIVLAGKATQPQRIVRAAETILADIQHGQIYPKNELGQLLQMKAEGQRFGLAVSAVNEILERKGFHLTQAGNNGEAWSVVPVKRSSRIISMLNKQGLKKLRRSALFAYGVLNEHGDKLDDDEKRKIEKQAQIQALRYMFASRVR